MAITGGKARARRAILFDSGMVSIGDAVTNATGTECTAIGAGAICPGITALALGVNTYSGDSSVAVGETARAEGLESVALGRSSMAHDPRSVVIGREAVAQGNPFNTGGVAIGHRARAGDSTSAATNYALAIGGLAAAKGNQSVAIGYTALAGSALAAFTIAIGPFSQAIAEEAIAIGHLCVSGGYASVAIGAGATVALGHNYSVAIGPSAATAAANEVVFMGATYGCVRFHAATDTGVELLDFDLSILLANNQTNLSLLVQDNAGAVSPKQITLAPAGGADPGAGFSFLQVANP